MAKKNSIRNCQTFFFFARNGPFFGLHITTVPTQYIVTKAKLLIHNQIKPTQ